MKRRNFFATLFGATAAIPLLGKELVAPKKLNIRVKETIGASRYNPRALKKLTFGVDPGASNGGSTTLTTVRHEVMADGSVVGRYEIMVYENGKCVHISESRTAKVLMCKFKEA